MQEDEVRRIRDEVRADRRRQGLPEQIEAAEAVDEVTAVLLLAERERRLGVNPPYDD